MASLGDGFPLGIPKVYYHSRSEGSAVPEPSGLAADVIGAESGLAVWEVGELLGDLNGTVLPAGDFHDQVVDVVVAGH